MFLKGMNKKVTLDMMVDEDTLILLALDITYRLGRDACRGLKSLFCWRTFMPPF
jgi:hypothetical protein